MEKIIERVNRLKDDKKCFLGYVKCFVNNKKANELYKQSKLFNGLKTSIKK